MGALTALAAAAVLTLAAAGPALGCAGDLSDIPYWSRLLRDPDPATRARAATALGEALTDPDARVRDAAARALERLKQMR